MPIRKLPGVSLQHMKNTERSTPQRMPLPKTLTIPMLMHIGTPAVPVVQTGDMVKVGQLIGEAQGEISAPVHSPVSGKVKKIDDILTLRGVYAKCVVIEPDGKQTLFEDIKPPKAATAEEFASAIQDSGIVGLGGAGFPTSEKLTVEDLNALDAIIINGAECEPYITADSRTMIDSPGLVWDGIGLLKKYLKVKRIIIGIEANKPQCIKNFTDLARSTEGVEVKVLPSIYPQGAEKVIIYHTTGRVVPEGKWPIDVGLAVINCTTLAAVARYMKTGMPLIEKCITVDGSAIKEPKNVIAPVGTPIRDVVNFCGGFSEEPGKIFYGGPMMGITVPDLDAPVLKTTNAIIALNEKEAVLPEETSCIKCGRCVDYCPLYLMPLEFERSYQLRDAAMLEKLKVNLCMECGCCSYVCPSRRRLVQAHKLGKILLKKYQEEKRRSNSAVSSKKSKGRG